MMRNENISPGCGAPYAAEQEPLFRRRPPVARPPIMNMEA
jgi:hypothetical protein